MRVLRYSHRTIAINSVYGKGSQRVQLQRGYQYPSIFGSSYNNDVIDGMVKNYYSTGVLGKPFEAQRRRDEVAIKISKQNIANAWLQRRSVFSNCSFTREGDDSFSRHSVPTEQRLSFGDRANRRHFSSSKATSGEDNSIDPDNNLVVVDYTSPLGALISRLKMVSITGCFLSVCVLPALVFLKNGDLPSARQVTLGTFATIGATGSTVALHFVFGAYVLEMKSVTGGDDNDSENQNRYLLEATTRSILGFWKNTHVFDPRKDVTPYVGLRPFANFCANHVPLYVHPERLDAMTRQLLLHSSDRNMDVTITDKNEGLSREHRVVNEGTIKKKKDEDDDFF
mmetsp:Transcript_11485/g.26970  ORF Transcript_11485/g.26970 Transcript_11485/m.26970 type:complete len:340 (+) Transcript_11485:56-1075(+)